MWLNIGSGVLRGSVQRLHHRQISQNGFALHLKISKKNKISAHAFRDYIVKIHEGSKTSIQNGQAKFDVENTSSSRYTMNTYQLSSAPCHLR